MCQGKELRETAQVSEKVPGKTVQLREPQKREHRSSGTLLTQECVTRSCGCEVENTPDQVWAKYPQGFSISTRTHALCASETKEVLTTANTGWLPLDMPLLEKQRKTAKSQRSTRCHAEGRRPVPQGPTSGAE